MASQKELMISGKFYDTTDPEIYGLRCKAHKLSNEYNATCDTDTEKKR